MNTIQTKDKTHWLAHSKLSCMAAAALAFSAFQGFAQPIPSQPVKNIVLVHGAFADGSSWSKVIRILQAKGYLEHGHTLSKASERAARSTLSRAPQWQL